MCDFFYDHVVCCSMVRHWMYSYRMDSVGWDSSLKLFESNRFGCTINFCIIVSNSVGISLTVEL